MKKVTDWYQQILIDIMKRLTIKDIIIVLSITIVFIIIIKAIGAMSPERWMRI